MFAKAYLISFTRTITGWFGQENPNDFQVERHNEAKDATRFQNGTPAIPSVYDSLAGIELVEAIGLKKNRSLDRFSHRLLNRSVAAGDLSATPLDPRKRGPQGAAIRSQDAVKAVEELARRGIVATSRDNNVRVAFHYYNTPGDIDALVEAFKELKGLMLVKQ